MTLSSLTHSVYAQIEIALSCGASLAVQLDHPSHSLPEKLTISQWEMV